MSFADPYLVTQFLHPRANAPDPLFPESIHPKGYSEFTSRLGLGSFCRGLMVLTPESRSSYWTPAMKGELLVIGLQQGNWEPGVLDPADLADCMVIAGSDTSDSYVTCPRFGPAIFELPRHCQTIRLIGEHIDSVAAAVDFAQPLMIPEDAHLEPNIGGKCKEHAHIGT